MAKKKPYDPNADLKFLPEPACDGAASPATSGSQPSGAGIAWAAVLAATEICPKDHSEQNAFEEWARKRGLNMDEHPLHYLFLDPKTDAARNAWKAALSYVRSRTSREQG
jgi:hypothetical protein